MEPTKMVDTKDDSYEIEPICIKNEPATKLEPYADQPMPREASGIMG